jgi:hypothetical protein
MAKDRALDRHQAPNYPYRPTPPDLLERLDERVGPGQRGKTLSALLAAYLDEEPMPARPWVAGEPGDTGQERGA